MINRITLGFLIDCLTHDIEDGKGFNFKPLINKELKKRFSTPEKALEHFQNVEKVSPPLPDGMEFESNHPDYGDETVGDIVNFIKKYGTPDSVNRVSREVTHRDALINAAPDMLNALEECIAYMEHYQPAFCGLKDDRACSPYNDAVEAVKKAKGAA